MKTIYFTEDYYPTDDEIKYLENALGFEIAKGDSNWINFYSDRMEDVNDLISLIGESYIKEVT